MDTLFTFQPNESSVSIHVAFLLCAALKGYCMKVFPYVNIDVPIKKKDHPYQTDFLICDFSQHKKSEQPVESIKLPCSMLIQKLGQSVMVIEVKRSVSVNFNNIDTQHSMELIIYCLYVMRIYDCNRILGSLTDGQTWHTLKFEKNGNTNTLKLLKHTVLSSVDQQIILGTIPKLLDL